MANLKLSAITASGASLASGDGIVGYQIGTTSDRLFTAAQLGAGIGPAGLGVATATSLAVNGATLGANALAVTGTIQSSGTIATGGNVTASAGFMSSNQGYTTITAAAIYNINGDTIFSRKAAANWQLGNADAAAPVAQTLGVQSVVAGTTNTSGQTTTLIGSIATGSGTSGDWVIKTGGSGAGATAQNTATTALTIKGVTQRVVAATTIATGGYTVVTLPAGVIGDRAYVTDALTPTFLGILTGGSSTVTPVFYNGSAWVAN